MMKINIADSNVIDSMADIGLEFFDKILDMDINKVLITDESSLSDFTFCGNFPESIMKVESYSEKMNMWDRWVINQITTTFGITVTPVALLIHIFDMIDNSRKPRMVH